MGMIWENIRDLRKSAGLTQAALAERLGMNRATISKYETGDICPPIPIIRKLCNIFGCDFHDIVQADAPQKSADNLIDTISQYQAILSVILDDAETPERIKDLIREELPKGDPMAPLSSLCFQAEYPETELSRAFLALTEEGRKKALERVEELTEIPKYQRRPEEGDSGAVDPQENDEGRA